MGFRMPVHHGDVMQDGEGQVWGALERERKSHPQEVRRMEDNVVSAVLALPAPVTLLERYWQAG